MSRETKLAASNEWLLRVTGDKTLSEPIFSELPRIADIVRSAFHHLASPLVLRSAATLAIKSEQPQQCLAVPVG